MSDLLEHYERRWGSGEQMALVAGPIHELPHDFVVRVFAPSASWEHWTYATIGMSQDWDDDAIELHMYAPSRDMTNVELLYATAHYHRTGARLGLHHTVNFGRPWYPESRCTHGFISLPYFGGPTLERCVSGDRTIRCLWLLPITAAEKEFAVAYGVEALESRLEAAQLDYGDPARPSVIAN